MNRGSAIRKTQMNRLKDGRGQEYGEGYKLFIQASDTKAPSLGYLTRELGWKTGRIHHTLSKEECRYLMVLTWSDKVVDIREQYPLKPIERSIEFAEQLNIKHSNQDNEPILTTTDLMITIETEKGFEDVVLLERPGRAFIITPGD